MLTINDPIVDYVIDLENRLEKAEQAENAPYTDIEVDEAENCPGHYRVWVGRRLLGTFYRLPFKKHWIATPFYQNGKFADTRAKSFPNSKKAQAFIVNAYLR